jgi:soluble lytic murein transglycosylase
MQVDRRSRPAHRRLAPVIALILGAAGLVGTPASAAEVRAASDAGFSLTTLSATDVQAYARAFQLTRDGRFAAAQDAVATVESPILKGRLAFAKLMHHDYRSSFEELSAWLEAYRDQPEAARIYALAKRRQPEGAKDPLEPRTGGSADWARIEALAERIEARTATAKPASRPVDPGLAAREAFYAGEVATAHRLANESGERWIAGLSAFQLKRYPEAQGKFAALAEDTTQDEWVRSGAAYWAARSAIASGTPEAAPQFLTIAARTPYTFYGLIAERQLGLEPAVGANGLDYAAIASRVDATPARPVLVGGADGAALARLARSDARAGRAVAFAQLGLKAEAGQEVRAALASAEGDARRSWTQLGLALNVPLTSAADLQRRPRFDIAQFPTPELTPNGGFTVDRALVYALVRQESRFNPDAMSAAGAHGLMQLMPDTAARVSGDSKLARDPAPLKDPAVNLRLGQDYVTRLLQVTKGDLLHAVAAYNAGPGTILKTLTRLGSEGDSLMAIESMPGAQTREFVEKVVAGYWIYRNIFGQDSRTLDAVASGAKTVMASLDLPGPAKAEAATLSTFFAAAR